MYRVICTIFSIISLIASDVKLGIGLSVQWAGIITDRDQHSVWCLWGLVCGSILPLCLIPHEIVARVVYQVQYGVYRQMLQASPQAILYLPSAPGTVVYVTNISRSAGLNWASQSTRSTLESTNNSVITVGQLLSVWTDLSIQYMHLVPVHCLICSPQNIITKYICHNIYTHRSRAKEPFFYMEHGDRLPSILFYLNNLLCYFHPHLSITSI